MITHVDDYIDKVQKKFPWIPHELIKKVAEFGLKKFHYLTKKGIDIKLIWDTYSIQCGRGPYLNRFYYYSIRQRLRAIYAYRLEKFDGYYYMALKPEEVKKYRTRKGRNGGYHVIENVHLYKIKEEVLSTGKYWTQAFRIKWPEDRGWHFKLDRLLTKTVDCIAKKDSKGNIILQNGKKRQCKNNAD